MKFSQQIEVTLTFTLETRRTESEQICRFYFISSKLNLLKYNCSLLFYFIFSSREIPGLKTCSPKTILQDIFTNDPLKNR
jgi:hypothetical protein